MSKLVTQSEYARRRGCSRQNIHKFVKGGILTLQDGKIDPEAADRILDALNSPAYARERRGLRVSEDGKGDSGGFVGDDHTMAYAQARAQREVIKLEMEKMELAERMQQLIRYDEAVNGSRALVNVMLQVIEPMADKLERYFRLASEVVLGIQDRVTRLREQLDQRLQELAVEWRS